MRQAEPALNPILEAEDPIAGEYSLEALPVSTWPLTRRAISRNGWDTS